MFLAPILGESPKFLDLYYKIQPGSDRVAKYHGDRPRGLGDLALIKKKTSRVNKT